MRLATFIEQNAEAVVSSAEEFCGTLLPAAGHLDSAALRDHLPKILDAIVRTCGKLRPAGGASQVAWWAPLIRRAGNRSADACHAAGSVRIRHRPDGFEYRALRASVLRLWQAREFARRRVPRRYAALQRSDRSALAESVSHFSAEAERWRNIFLAVLGHDLRGPLNAVLLTPSCCRVWIG